MLNRIIFKRNADGDWQGSHENLTFTFASCKACDIVEMMSYARPELEVSFKLSDLRTDDQIQG